MGKVSIVGAGMRSHPGVAATVFTVLGDAGINIEMISTSPIKISCVIAGDRVPEAVRGLHARVRPRGRGHDHRRGPVRRPAMSAAPRVAVVGATGAVGRIMLEVLAARGFAASEIVPFASERSAGRELPGVGTVAAAARRRRSRGFDIALFSAGGAHLARVGAALRGRRRDRRRQLERLADGPAGAARRQRGQPATRSTASSAGSSPTPTARRWRSCCR